MIFHTKTNWAARVVTPGRRFGKNKPAAANAAAGLGLLCKAAANTAAGVAGHRLICMIQGDAEDVGTKLSTEYSIKALLDAGFKADQLAMVFVVKNKGNKKD